MTDTDDIEFLCYSIESLISSKNLDIDESVVGKEYRKWKVSTGPLLSCEIELIQDKRDICCNIYPIFVDLSSGEDVYLPPASITSTPTNIRSWIEVAVIDTIGYADDLMEILTKVSDSIFSGGFIGSVSEGEVSSCEDGVSFPFIMDHEVDKIKFSTELTISANRTDFSTKIVTTHGAIEVYNKFICKTTSSPVVLSKIIFAVKEMMDVTKAFVPVKSERIYEQLVRSPGCYGPNVVAFRKRA